MHLRASAAAELRLPASRRVPAFRAHMPVRQAPHWCARGGRQALWPARMSISWC